MFDKLAQCDKRIEELKEELLKINQRIEELKRKQVIRKTSQYL